MAKTIQLQLDSLTSMIQHLKQNKKYKEAIKYATFNYQVAQYNISKLKLEEIPELVNLIELNYINLYKQNENSQEKKKNSWLPNQLKLFVWMAVCHSFLINKPLEEYDEKDWIFFTQVLTRKSCNDLDFQSKSLLKNFHGNKEKWTQEQQNLLKFIIQQQQTTNRWNEISRLLYFNSNKIFYRSAQKCREYWYNHLDPALNKKPWTVDEDLRLVMELQTYGFKWSKLTQIIESTWGYRRTEHMVKNRARLLCKKYGYNEQKEQGFMKQLKKIEKRLREQKQKQQNNRDEQLIKHQQNMSSSNLTAQTKLANQTINKEEQFDRDNQVRKSNTLGFRDRSAYPNRWFSSTANSFNQNFNARGLQSKQFHRIEEQLSESKSEQAKYRTQKQIPMQQPRLNGQPSNQQLDYSQSSQSQGYDQSQDNKFNHQRFSSNFYNQQANKINNSQQNVQIAETSNKRNVIILFQAKNKTSEQPSMIDELDEDSPDIIIDSRVDQGQEGYYEGDAIDVDDCYHQKEESYFNEYNNVEEEQQIDFNDDMQFQHDTHGGRMRERVTHQLAKFFSPNVAGEFIS